jgi:hypothetical protein
VGAAVAAYAAEKARTHPGRTILIREGNLRRAASEPRREATPRTLTLWIDDENVAGYHQDGTDRMPARPLIPENGCRSRRSATSTTPRRRVRVGARPPARPLNRI